MQKKDFNYLVLFFSLFVFLSCSSQVTSRVSAPDSSSKGQEVSSAPCIIYKTRSDYAHNVPVTLNEKKSGLTSYPGVKDLMYQGRMAYPTELAQGFLLDNRGIGPNVAFLDYTYEQYQELDQVPGLEQLMKHITDKDPVTEMYNCGPRSQYKDIENDLNKLINSGNLNSCKKIK